jgi:hypothetical protein
VDRAPRSVRLRNGMVTTMPRGLARKTLDLFAAAAAILASNKPATVHGICYQHFNQKMLPDMGKAATDRVSGTLTTARERGVIVWEWILVAELVRVRLWPAGRTSAQQGERQQQRRAARPQVRPARRRRLGLVCVPMIEPCCHQCDARFRPSFADQVRASSWQFVHPRRRPPLTSRKASA